jgi:hypothetical protein
MVASATLPPGIGFASVRMPGAVCAVSNKVTCRIPSLPVGVTVMEIDASPTAVGDLAISAEATTTTFDPNGANNAQTKTIVVGASTAAIQQQIDNALPGVPVVVDPGTYVGTLTFRGKNITLVSRDGPATTRIIQPTGLSAVQMGTGGTLTGFTIVARSAGVEVDGAGGSVITGNVFDPALWGEPIAIGVYGVNAFAGATVQNNTFRHHACPAPSVLGVEANGVVMFSSLPNATGYGAVQVSGNTFESNNCPDIGIGTLPSNTNITIDTTGSGSIVGLPQPQTVVTAGATLTLSQTSANGIINWSLSSLGTGGSVNLTAPVQTLGSGNVVLTGTLSGGATPVLTLQ